jgi:hypothetical protein
MGRLLVLAETDQRANADPVMTSFLAFLAQDVVAAPRNMRPLDMKLAKRTDELTGGVVVSPDEDLGDRIEFERRIIAGVPGRHTRGWKRRAISVSYQP